MVFSRTCSTDAEDGLPTSASERRVSSTALSGSLKLFSMASMTLGPPGWQTQAVISSTVSPCSVRKGADAAAKPPLDHVVQFRR